MIRINLLPVRVSKKKEAGKNQLIFLGLAVVFALVCNFWWARRVLDKLKAGRQGPVRMLDELAGLTPKRVWLRKMDEKQGAVQFEGSAGTIDDVSVFLAALKKAQYFSAPELKRTSARPEGKLKLVEFTITATVNYTPTVQVAASGVPGAPDGKAR